MEEEEATSTLWLGNLDPHKVTRRIIYEVGIQVSRERAELLQHGSVDCSRRCLCLPAPGIPCSPTHSRSPQQKPPPVAPSPHPPPCARVRCCRVALCAPSRCRCWKATR